MRSIPWKSGLLATALVMGAGVPARASTLDVKVPFPFVVNGRTMPAGTYRLDQEGGVVEIRGEKGNHQGMFILTTPAGGRDPAGRKPVLTFARDENAYRLTGIWQSSRQGERVRR